MGFWKTKPLEEVSTCYFAFQMAHFPEESFLLLELPKVLHTPRAFKR